MMSVIRASASTEIRVVWALAAFLLFGVGVGRVWWPASQKIASIQRHALAAYERANAADVVLRDADRILRAKKSIRDDIRHLSAVREGGTWLNALRLLNAESKRFSVQIREYAPHDIGKSVGTGPPGIQACCSVVFRLRGDFRAIVRLLADLPQRDVLIDLYSVSMHAHATKGGREVVDAEVRARLYEAIHEQKGPQSVRLVR